jgi:hypothetical protein
MPILSALLSLLSRKVGDLLQAIFGWSITGLFGRLPVSKQRALSVAVLLSVAWPVLLTGIFFPGVAAWAITLVPLHDWVGASVLRGIWIGLAVVAPITVGLITKAVAPKHKQKRGTLALLASGVPLTLGFAAAFVTALVVVPMLKLGALARRWRDEHVHLQVGEGAYEEVFRHVRRACGEAGLLLDEEPVPRLMATATNVLKAFAGGAVSPMIAEHPRRLRGDGLELYLYPGDLLIRGEPAKVSRVRVALLIHLLHAPAHLTEHAAGQAVEDELHRMWGVVERHRHAGEIGRLGHARLRQIANELETLDVPFAEWTLLYTNLGLLERAMTGGARLVEMEPASPVGQAHVETEGERSAAVPTRNDGAEASELVREAIAQAKDLLAAEVELARTEVRQDLRAARTSAIAFGAALVAAIVGISLLLVALALAIAPRPVPALVTGVALLIAAGATAAFGYSRVPKNPLERTRKRLKTDARILQERIA